MSTADDKGAARHVVLIGPMGAGKTTVGRLVAERLQRRFVDTDQRIEAATGNEIREIFVSEGEDAFRAMERETVVATLAEAEGAVVAVGGGSVLDATNREALGAHTVVFLDVGLGDAARRVGLGVARPMLLGNVRGRLRTLMDERRPTYAGLATVTVPTDGRTPDEVADAVVHAIEQPIEQAPDRA